MWKKSLQLILFLSLATSQSTAAEQTDNKVIEDTPQNPTKFTLLTNKSIGQYLGWVSDDSCYELCGGYYLDAPIVFNGKTNQRPGDMTHSPLNITAESGDFFLSGKSTLQGHVVMTQPGRQVIADTAYVYRGDEGNLEQINMLGNVYLHEKGKLAIADVAYVPVIDGKAANFSLYDVIYRISLGTSPHDVRSAIKSAVNDGAINPEQTDQPALEAETTEITEETDDSSEPNKTKQLTAWGYAKEVHQDSDEQMSLKHLTYSTCPPTSEDCAWHLSAYKLTINNETERGHSYNSTLWAKNIPIMYLPYLSFPLSDKRQSGFLFPSFTRSSTSGLGVSAPYYVNLAPNYDLTVTPYLYEWRGLYLDNQFRYLTASSAGFISLGVLPDDREFAKFQEQAETEYQNKPSYGELESASTTRRAFRWQDQTVFNKNWVGSVDYNYVSDDYFIEDNIPQNIAGADNSQLLRKANVDYYGEHWTFQGLLQSYQTLHPVDQNSIDNQYARLPELTFNADYPDQAKGLETTFTSQYDYFYMEKDPGDSTDPTTGNRFNVRPGISLPNKTSYGYVTPTLQLDFTGYQLTDPEEDNPENPTRSLPLFNIDSGLYFNRQTSVFGDSYLQTFEPRLYYLYVPYTDQDDLPDFTSALYTLTYDQLFQNNRFSSVDRVGDANQLSMGATSRYIDQESGAERFNVAAGAIWYLRNRDVTLCTTESCKQDDSQEFSPAVAQANYHLSDFWHVRGDTSYDFGNQEVENTSLTIQFKKDNLRVINLGYSYVAGGEQYTTSSNTSSDLANLSQLHLSYAWPINEQWSTLGSIDFNTSYGNGVSFLAGAEYSSCCWGVKFFMDQDLTGVKNDVNQYDRTYYVQFVLKGLGNFGNQDPTNLISKNISGYNDEFIQTF